MTTYGPLELGEAAEADHVLLDRISKGEPVDVNHPDDRAGVIAAIVAGRFSRQTALRALRCSGSVLAATVNAYITQTTQEN